MWASSSFYCQAERQIKIAPWKNASEKSQNGQNGHGKIRSENDPGIYGDSKESFQLALGTYRACAIPMLILVIGYSIGVIMENLMKPDPRVKDWPLMSSSVNFLIICVLYILFSIVWGPRLMKNRKPLKLNKTMIVYNAFQVALSIYTFVEVGLAAWFFDYNLLCEPCDYSDSPKAVRVANVTWVFFISKILDLVDTLFFVLHKKWNQISTLHVVHHSSMCSTIWFGVKYMPGGHLTFFGFINSGVHVLMYSYYLLSAFGPNVRPYLWWKRYLTSIQLIQFVVVFFQTVSSLFIDCPSAPVGIPIWICTYAVIYFALFTDFYYRAYLHPVKKIKQPYSTTENKMEVIDDRNLVDFNVKPYTESTDADNDVSKKQIENSSNLIPRLDWCVRERNAALTKP